MRLWIIYIAPLRHWLQPQLWRFWGSGSYFYIFRNMDRVIPGRWGFGICGLIEIGSRNSGNKIGVWLKRVGLWPW